MRTLMLASLIWSAWFVLEPSTRLAHAAPSRGGQSKRVDPEQTEDDRRAKKLFEDGTRAFNLGEFPSAVDLYRQAYKLKPEPGLLYNIAQAYRLANDLQNAAFFYRSFLRAAPQTPNRKEIEDRIRKLELQLSERQAPPNSPVSPGALPADGHEVEPARPAPRPDPSAEAPAVELTKKPEPVVEKTPVYKKWWLWTVVGVAVVGVGLGVGLGLGLQSSPPSTHFGSRPVF